MSERPKVNDLTKGLRTMKFMKRKKPQLSGVEYKKEQAEIQMVQEDKTKKLALHMNEFWSLEISQEFSAKVFKSAWFQSENN